ncbi:hypothetical protein GAGA_4590 [Paraglaciecola agarilytica NO2]|uniref:Uncharacterized protein n=1 Tax=Paraglaciecola agarilytica NO2 TaxID=1125747 RepID=A0ABQ0IDG2_9ALTE|nr:hypothetical protein GAGA_4590 [Paraglaciecola agarilytica NO2]
MWTVSFAYTKSAAQLREQPQPLLTILPPGSKSLSSTDI